MNDDPNSVADALDEAEATEATGTIFAALTAAGYEVVPAGTADRLAAAERWKAEATEVIESWERVYDALGDVGGLGQRRSDAVLAEVLRMKAEGERLRGVLAATQLRLLHASEVQPFAPDTKDPT